MNKYSTYISTGNCFPLNRSRSDIKESIEIVAGTAEEPYIYDTFSFVASEYASLDLFDTQGDEFLIGTGTTSCFSWDGMLVGGLLISLPFPEHIQIDDADELLSAYIPKFGDSLVETFQNRPQPYDTQIGDLTADEVGFDGIDVQLLDERTITNSETGAAVKVVSFRSDSTVNILYLLSEGKQDTGKYRSLVRHLDTMAVFESPQTATKSEGTAYIPCQRVLDSTRFQSYMESDYDFSIGTRANLNDVTEPELFFDSRLSFTLSQSFGSDVTVELIGSQNTHQIENRVRENSRHLQSHDTSKYITIMGGVVGRTLDDTENIFIGQLESNWACGCDTKFCPTVVTIRTENEITEEIMSDVDDILQDVTGQMPIEVSVGGKTVDTIA